MNSKVDDLVIVLDTKTHISHYRLSRVMKVFMEKADSGEFDRWVKIRLPNSNPEYPTSKRVFMELGQDHHSRAKILALNWG